MGKSPFIKQLKSCAAAAKNYAVSLVLQAAEEMGKDLEAMEAKKQDKRNAVAVTIPAAGWSSDGTAGYPYYCDLAVPGVTAKDRAEVTVSVAGLTTAADCGLCPTNETLDGKIRLRAKKAPAAAMSAEYWLEKGAQGL